VAREETEMAGGGSVCSLTTIQWGTTCEVEDITNSNKEIHRYLAVCAYYDLLEEKGIIPHTIC